MMYGTEESEAYYVMANTIDLLKELNQNDLLKEWVPLFLDEFETGDTAQVGALSANALKVLVDVPAGGSIRCRYHDLVLAPNMPRLFAANAASSDEWLQSIGASSAQHRLAVEKRMLFFCMSSSVVPLQFQNRTGMQSLIDPRLKAALSVGRAYVG